VFREKTTKTGRIIRYLMNSGYRKGEIVSSIDKKEILGVDLKLPKGRKLEIG
jgi:hypothetical protein